MERIGRLLDPGARGLPTGEIWHGDDAAVLGPRAAGLDLLFCTDVAVAGVHTDLDLLEPWDLGWKALATTISDIAAMGGAPLRAVVAVQAAPGTSAVEVMEGAAAAGAALGCPIVGGDVVAAPVLAATASVLGAVPRGRAVRRDGAQPGDLLFVTGALGASAAGLRQLRAGGPNREPDLRDRHRRPVARLAEGRAARVGGATAMLDVSDGFGRDLDQLCRASKVGAVIDQLPVVEGATTDEALGGGEDYELLFTAPDQGAVARAFEMAGLGAPLLIGRVTASADERTLEGRAMEPEGYRHDVS